MSFKDLYNQKYAPEKIVPKVEIKPIEMKDVFAPKNIYTSPTEIKKPVEKKSFNSLYNQKYAPEKIVAPQPQIPSYLQRPVTTPTTTPTNIPETTTKKTSFSNTINKFSSVIPSVFEPIKTFNTLKKANQDYNDLKKEEYQNKNFKNEEIKKYNLENESLIKEIGRLLLPKKAEQFLGIDKIKETDSANNLQFNIGENLNKSQKTKADEVINNIIKPQVKKTVMERDSLKNVSPLGYNVANKMKVFDENSRVLERIIGTVVYTPYDILSQVVKRTENKIINTDNKIVDVLGVKGVSLRNITKTEKVLREQLDKAILKGLNSDAGLSTIDFVSKNSEDLPLKGYSLLKSIGESTYKDEYEKIKNDLSGENSNYLKKTFYQTQSSIGQTGIGVLLSLSLGKINPRLGKTVSGSYWGALSASEQVSSTGGVYNTNKILIDVVGDSFLGNQIEKTLKSPKSLLKQTLNSFNIEGGTEVGQSVLKFAEDYKEAKTIEKKEQILSATEDYINSGALATEYLVGGLSGASISILSVGVNNAITNVKDPEKEAEDVEKDIEKIKQTIENYKNTPISENEITTQQDKNEVILLLEGRANQLLLALPQIKMLAEGRGKQTTFQGEGFVMNEKVDKQNAEKQKLSNDYRQQLQSYNQNPTPYKLKRLLNLRKTIQEEKGIKQEPTKEVYTAVNQKLRQEMGIQPKTEATPVVEQVKADTLEEEMRATKSFDEYIKTQDLDKDLVNVYNKLYGKTTNQLSQPARTSKGEGLQGDTQRGENGNSKKIDSDAISSIIQVIKENPGGFTINLKGTPITSGFAVSPFKGRELIFNKEEIENIEEIEETFDKYLMDNFDLFLNKENNLGGWKNPQDGKYYLDVSVVKNKIEDAIETAVYNDQIGIYDLEKGAKGEDGTIFTKDFIKQKLEERWNKVQEPAIPATPKQNEIETKTNKEKETFKSKIFEDYKKAYGLRGADGQELASVDLEKMATREQFDKAGDYTLKNPEKAVRIAYGVEDVPSGYRLIAFQGAVAEYLLSQRNNELAYEIMRKQSTELSETAQNLNLAKIGVSNFTQQLNNIENEKLINFGIKTSKLKGADLIKHARLQVKEKTTERAKTVRENINKNLEQSLNDFDSILNSMLC